MSRTELSTAPINAAPCPLGYALVKRILDVFLCLFLLPLVIAPMALIALAICLESRSSPIFVQERVGRGRRRFRLYKFRTMVNGCDNSDARQFMKAYVRGQVEAVPAGVPPAVFKPNHDTYMTRVGRVLRKTSLDELPQLLNVLRGEMSLVGPRPHVHWEVEEYRPWHLGRLDVLPGITGLAQVSGRSGISFDAMVRYDLQYVQERSLMLDLKILWWTLLSVARAQGAT